MQEQPKQLNNSNNQMQSENKKDKKLRRPSDYEEFIVWYALPLREKMRMGIETQEAFAEHYELNSHSLSNWKKRFDFMPRVYEIRHEWAKERGADVVDAIYRTALKGNPLSQKLWMQVFEGFSEKSTIEETKKVELSVNDIRFLIESLPEHLRAKHYANLRELIDDASRAKDTGQLEIRAIGEGPPDSIPGEAYNISPDVPSAKTNVVAESN